jgi:hypothetical protein
MRGKFDWPVWFFTALFVLLGISSNLMKATDSITAHKLVDYSVFMGLLAVIFDIVASFFTGKAGVRGAIFSKEEHPILFHVRVFLSFAAGAVAIWYLAFGICICSNLR